jgi:hypothetical protein
MATAKKRMGETIATQATGQVLFLLGSERGQIAIITLLGRVVNTRISY